MTSKKLFLLDAYALIFRGYYAFIKNPRITSKGLNTSAIIGFMNSLMDILKREKPDFIAVAFDKGGSHERTQIFSDYKANRDETPEAIRTAIPYIHRILQAMEIPVVEVAGYEADDIIGTLAKDAEKHGLTTYMVTPDKDFGQLVSEHIFMYRPAKNGKDIEIWGLPEVKEKFGVESAEQVIDFLGMMGDAVDNIPGLPGVGEVTAKKLLAEFGSMENLLANTDKLKGKLKENIEAHKEQGLLSKRLARILLDVPVAFDEETFAFSNSPKMDEITSIFEELEFRTLLESVRKFYKGATIPETSVGNSRSEAQQLSLFPEETTSSLKTIKDIPHNYRHISTNEEITNLLAQLLQQKEVCFDTETTSLDELEAELVGLAFSWEKHSGYYISFTQNDLTAEKLSLLKPFFESTSIVKVAQNLKYDLKVLANYGVRLCEPFFDTMLAHYLINPDMRHNMDALAESYLRYSPISIENLIGKKGKNQLSMRLVPIAEQTEYAVEDTDVTLQLKQVFAPVLAEQKLQPLFDEVEVPLVPVLAAMEREGIAIDVPFLKKLSLDTAEELSALENEIHSLAGEPFNLSSPKQLGDILFDKLKLSSKPTKTKTGQYATSEAILSELAAEHLIVQKVLEYRQLQKLQSTYIDALPSEVSPKTHRVHTSYMQALTATGRLSSSNPNLQNIPIRTPRGQQIRKAFIPRDENYSLLSADYSQIELRVIASLSQEAQMISDFQQNIDIHRATAARVFNRPIDEITKEERGHAKTINFGILYGVSAHGLSAQTNLTRSQSKNLIDAYYETYPQLKKYMAEQVDFARRNGYVQTIMGRRRYLPDINSANQVVKGAAERNAVNTPIQGSAADIIKIAMIRIFRQLEQRKLRSKMLLQVHDELVFDVFTPEMDEVKALIKHEMENAYPLQVPLVVEIGTGANWLEAH